MKEFEKLGIQILIVAGLVFVTIIGVSFMAQQPMKNIAPVVGGTTPTIDVSDFEIYRAIKIEWQNSSVVETTPVNETPIVNVTPVVIHHHHSTPPITPPTPPPVPKNVTYDLMNITCDSNMSVFPCDSNITYAMMFNDTIDGMIYLKGSEFSLCTLTFSNASDINGTLHIYAWSSWYGNYFVVNNQTVIPAQDCWGEYEFNLTENFTTIEFHSVLDTVWDFYHGLAITYCWIEINTNL